jgi:hypothetical protein
VSRLGRLSAQVPIADKNGLPTQKFQWDLQQAFEQLEGQVTALASAVAAITAAQAAADAANTAATAANAAATTANTAAVAITSASALANSFVANFTPPMISAASTGVVTIAAHNRTYGNGTTVAVSGGSVATGQVNPTVVYIFYDQASRAGGAVTYQYSTDEADVAQIGNRHSVGAVTIPAAGSASGGYARPPGYGGIEPTY